MSPSDNVYVGASQALLALVAWLRLLQILFLSSKSGPLLLMAIRMLEDLWQVIAALMTA